MKLILIKEIQLYTLHRPPANRFEEITVKIQEPLFEALGEGDNTQVTDWAGGH